LTRQTWRRGVGWRGVRGRRGLAWRGRRTGTGGSGTHRQV
jgi:hypothetical protein